MKNSHYVLRWRATSYDLVGPFDTQAAAAAWGSEDQRANGDNPCWNTIRLADAHTSPRVIAPERV